MVAATVTGLLASSLPGDVGVNGTVRIVNAADLRIS